MSVSHLSVHPRARLARLSLELLLGAIVIGCLVGGGLALLVYLPAVAAEMPGAVVAAERTGSGAVEAGTIPTIPSGGVGFGLSMGVASGAVIGAVGGISAIAGLISVAEIIAPRPLASSPVAVVVGTSVGAAGGVLLASSLLLVSRDSATWTASGTATLCALVTCALGSWALIRHESRVRSAVRR